MKKILVTGANGFIGKNICQQLIKLNYSVKGIVRNLDNALINSDTKYISVGNIDAETNWDHILDGIDCIIHCAGKVHSINAKVELDIYRAVNRDGTKHLAEQAVKAGVKRLIFLSSVKVNGENTEQFNRPKVFSYNDIPNPKDNYAISKHEAEQVLRELASKTGLEVVIVRIPLVYGNFARGNFGRLMKLISYNIPLPFGGIKNKRSFIGIDNLKDVIVRCVEHSNIGSKTFLVSDGEYLSTPEFIRLIASMTGQSVKLFKVPLFLLNFFGFIMGKQSEINRLVESLVIDNSYARKILNWTPPVSLEEGIRRAIKSK